MNKQDQNNVIFCYCDEMIEADFLAIDLLFCEIQVSLRKGEADYRAIKARAAFKKWNNAIEFRASNNEDATIF